MMMPRKFETRPFAQRARRSAREIVIAVILTFAAIVFIIAAVYGSGSKTASVTTQQDAADKRPN